MGLHAEQNPHVFEPEPEGLDIAPYVRGGILETGVDQYVSLIGGDQEHAQVSHANGVEVADHTVRWKGPGPAFWPLGVFGESRLLGMESGCGEKRQTSDEAQNGEVVRVLICSGWHRFVLYGSLGVLLLATDNIWVFPAKASVIAPDAYESFITIWRVGNHAFSPVR
jgi:hypothetical protein